MFLAITALIISCNNIAIANNKDAVRIEKLDDTSRRQLNTNNRYVINIGKNLPDASAEFVENLDNFELIENHSGRIISIERSRITGLSDDKRSV